MQDARASIASPPPAYPENIALYENAGNEPRYSSIQQLQSALQLTDGINLIENGIPANMVRFCGSDFAAACGSWCLSFFPKLICCCTELTAKFSMVRSYTGSTSS